jgi:cystathionine beta-lyase/cystathionine gamma-synthase
MSPAERRQAGISDGLIRMSVGLEAVEEIVEDLLQALEVATVTAASDRRP